MEYNKCFWAILLGTLNLVSWGNCAATSKNTEYLLIPERSTYTYINPEFCGSDLSVTIRRLNRTTFSLSAVINYLKDIEDAENSVEFFQFLNNEYKKTGIIISAPICDMIGDPDLNIYKEYMMDGIHGNMPECDGTFPKGQYFVKDAVVASEIKKTIFLPGKWKAVFQCTNKDDVIIFIGEFYFTIDEKLVT
ncbi:uncharacterized protein LOC123291397 [Chrysoperla carnea]|uniref:uncharacterized protein LOC123291397 n=1 Tax=Chrysoperla carnea TaxID=189513 RepID=UPI001D06063A|nr:uncharacterized protein LOC123291397 [Chrysoperla carnea]